MHADLLTRLMVVQSLGDQPTVLLPLCGERRAGPRLRTLLRYGNRNSRKGLVLRRPLNPLEKGAPNSATDKARDLIQRAIVLPGRRRGGAGACSGLLLDTWPRKMTPMPSE